MKGNYDTVAPFYDSLARLIFGKAIERAQLFLLQGIPAGSHLLIVGGGTGWILEAISQVHASGLTITFVEISAKMLRLSQKRKVGANKVLFVQQAIQDVTFNTSFDVIITPFLFDNFTDETAKVVFEKLNGYLKKEGNWLYCDFQITQNKTWQKILLKAMYLFFNILCKLETTKLPDIHRLFNSNVYKIIAEQNFYGQFIQSLIYHKKDNNTLPLLH
jgi:ubiquinone/menaquinone biosynthesis C-methylase UbiE